MRQKTDNLEPRRRTFGEYLVESTKQRFNTATDPEGNPRAANRPVTILRYLGLQQSNFKKDGSLSKQGQAVQGSKKPLTGTSKTLKKQIVYRLKGNTLEVGSTVVYSAAQPFGAPKGSLGPNAP